MLYRITSNYFCAGFITKNGKALRAAPIIKWSVGKHTIEIRAYCKKRGWKLEKIKGSGTFPGATVNFNF